MASETLEENKMRARMCTWSTRILVDINNVHVFLPLFFTMNANLTGHVSVCKTGVHRRKSAGGPVYWDDRPTLYETYTRMRLTDYLTQGSFP